MTAVGHAWANSSTRPRFLDRTMMSAENRWFRVRVTLLAVIMVVAAIAVAMRAFEVQVLQADELQAMARAQQLRELRIAPKRGGILDRHGAELAVSVDAESLWANPRQLQLANVDLDELAQELASMLDLDEETLRTRFHSRRFFVWIKRHLDPKKAEQIKERRIPGLQLTLEARRFYPNRELASHVLGFANIDGKGMEGLELSYDEVLRGASELLPAVRDRSGSIVFAGRLSDRRITQGDDIVLSIDRSIQHIAERELSIAARGVEAKSGSIVVIDPKTGDVLALANYPRFNPNHYRVSTLSQRRNRAVTDRFEPGSTIKPFTVAGAIARGAISPSSRIFCEHGKLQVADAIIHDTHSFGHLSVSEILAFSSNIGTAKIAQTLGKQRLHETLRGFGFGAETGISLPGETSGLLRHHRRWYEVDAATAAFGQGIGINAVQLAYAMGALANDGVLMKPRLVLKVSTPEGRVVQNVLPERRRVVVPPEVARGVTSMLVKVTEQGGTGVEAAIPGYRVAGKTGTAQKAGKRGGYAAHRWLSSFAGYVPAGDPKVVVSVVLDEPLIEYHGGVVAAPVFRRVGEQVLTHLGVPPDRPSKAAATRKQADQWAMGAQRAGSSTRDRSPTKREALRKGGT